MQPKKAYDDQKRHASDRQISFLITYSEWLEMWLLSGYWYERGKHVGNYQMCRRGDIGAYTIKNCYIGTMEQNQEEKSVIEKEKVILIKRMYLDTAMSQYDVAKEFGINQSHVSRIVSGKRRKQVEENYA